MTLDTAGLGTPAAELDDDDGDEHDGEEDSINGGSTDDDDVVMTTPMSSSAAVSPSPWSMGEAGTSECLSLSDMTALNHSRIHFISCHGVSSMLASLSVSLWSALLWD